jgi:hypothetical protein
VDPCCSQMHIFLKWNLGPRAYLDARSTWIGSGSLSNPAYPNEAQGWQPAAHRRNEAGVRGEWNTVSVLCVGRLGARISGSRWGKMLRVKWPWLRAPFIASGR